MYDPICSRRAVSDYPGNSGPSILRYWVLVGGLRSSTSRGALAKQTPRARTPLPDVERLSHAST